MWFRKNKEKEYIVPLEEPAFTEAEKEVLRGSMASSVWVKVRKHLDYMLLRRFLNSDCSNEFKRGWLSCRQAMDNLPIAQAEEEPEEQFTSMQGV